MAMCEIHPYLSFWFTSVNSIKNYVSGICILNELNGFEKVYRGTLYRNIIRGLRRELKHEVKQAKPLTIDLLHHICDIVNLQDQKELVAWVVVLFRFALFLRKSNLVPDSSRHLPKFNISRRDIRYHDRVLVTNIK